MKKKYDYLIVGAGLYGSVFAYKAQRNGKNVCLLTNVHTMEEIFIAKILRV